MLGQVVHVGALGVVVLPLEGHLLTGPQLAHELDGLTETSEALLEVGPFALESGGVLVERLAGADAEHDAVGIEAAHRRERLRDDGGVVAEGRGQDRRADLYALGALADRSHPRQGERRVAAVVAPRLEMVADGDRVHAVFLGRHGDLHQLAGRELLRRGLVSELELLCHAFTSLPTTVYVIQRTQGTGPTVAWDPGVHFCTRGSHTTRPAPHEAWAPERRRGSSASRAARGASCTARPGSRRPHRRIRGTVGAGASDHADRAAARSDPESARRRLLLRSGCLRRHVES